MCGQCRNFPWQWSNQQWPNFCDTIHKILLIAKNCKWCHKSLAIASWMNTHKHTQQQQWPPRLQLTASSSSETTQETEMSDIEGNCGKSSGRKLKQMKLPSLKPAQRRGAKKGTTRFELFATCQLVRWGRFTKEHGTLSGENDNLTETNVFL